MMENKGQKDIVPELLEKIKKDFEKEYNNNKVIQTKLKKLAEKSSDYLDINEYAQKVGEILSKVLGLNVTVEVLPDGKMYYNIANRILDDSLRNNHKLVSDYLAETQTNINHSQGYTIKGIKPKYSNNQAKGLVEKLVAGKKFDDSKWVLDEGVISFTIKIVYQGLRDNADLHYKAGLEPKIRRVALYNACDWCKNLQGTYLYENVKDTGNDVFRRHRYCRCYVMYVPYNGKIQNSHTKEWLDEKTVKKEIKNSGLYINEKQFGKKLGKHAEEFNLNPKKEEDRLIFFKIIEDIFKNKDEVVENINWRGQPDLVKAYIKADNAIIVSKSNKFITILKGGKNNARIENARKQKF